VRAVSSTSTSGGGTLKSRLEDFIPHLVALAPERLLEAAQQPRSGLCDACSRTQL
jgi:hypothetical protein